MKFRWRTRTVRFRQGDQLVRVRINCRVGDDSIKVRFRHTNRLVRFRQEKDWLGLGIESTSLSAKMKG